jgi:hypothetical protein
MQQNNNRTMYILLGVAGLAILGGIITLSVWGSSSKATPTVSLDAIYTAAYETFTVQRATQQALTPPTGTSSPTLFPTLPVPTQPLATSAFASATSPSGTGGGCDNSAFVSDVTIPDGTVMSQGQTFTKTWLVQNTGTCTWSTSYKLAFAAGEQMGGAATAVPNSVAPGGQVQISVNLTAPAKSGTNLTGNWKLQNASGQFFGTYLTVVITIPSASATAATNTPANTSAPTNTSIPPTNTSTPTETPTP